MSFKRKNSQPGRWLAAVSLAVLGCSTGLPEAAPPDPRASGIELELVRFQGYRAGEREVEVVAARGRIDSEGSRAELERVRIALDGISEGGVSVSADYGTVDLAEDDFLLSGNVQGEVADGQRFRTSDVRYLAKQQRLVSDQSVHVDRGPLRLVGEGMEIDLKNETLRITGQVRAELDGVDE